MADDTPASRSGKPSGEDSGLAKDDDNVGRAGISVATGDDVIASLKRKPTETLRAAVVAGETTLLSRQVKSDCLASNPAKVCELSEASLIELASPIFRARIARNKNFKDELKEASKQYDAVYDGDAWTAKGVTPGSVNEQYEQWLDSGNVLKPSPPGPGFSAVLQPESGVKRHWLLSAYDLAAGSGQSYGAVLISIKDGCLWTLCELADQLEMTAIACMQHIMMRECAMEPPNFLDSTSPKLSDEGFELNGLAIKRGNGQATIRFEVPAIKRGDGQATIRVEVPSYNSADATQDALDQARVRMTCLRLRSCFVVLVTEATRPLGPLPGGQSYPVPLLPSVHIESLSFMYFVKTLFDDALNVRRLWGVPDTWPQFMKAFALEWLLIVSAFIGEICVLAETIQKLDYEVVTLSSSAALTGIKDLRARVARLRAQMADSSYFHRRNLGRALIPAPENGTGESEALSTYIAPTERELANVSYASEYAWMDKQAAALMVPLNQSLQLVVAQISIEQTAASLEMSNIMARDSAIGIKNGERSTQLTLLAAIYLPLTLATGIFGMNIKEINDGTPPFWWVLILAVVLFIPSGCFIVYILWTSRQDKRLEQQKNQGDQEEQTTRGPEGGNKQVKKE